MQHKYGKAPKTAQRKARRKTEFNILPHAGYDPERLYVECGRCGAPVLWEPGKATELLNKAGVDPVELDSSCILITDACPACGSSNDFPVRIFRVSDSPADLSPHPCGHA